MQYTHILQGKGQTFYEQFCSRVNDIERTLKLAGHDLRPSLLKNFRGHCDLWEEAVFNAALAFVQSPAGMPDNTHEVDKDTLFKV